MRGSPAIPVVSIESGRPDGTPRLPCHLRKFEQGIMELYQTEYMADGTPKGDHRE